MSLCCQDKSQFYGQSVVKTKVSSMASLLSRQKSVLWPVYCQDKSQFYGQSVVKTKVSSMVSLSRVKNQFWRTEVNFVLILE